MVKIRLQRKGRRNKPFYSIVVADSRSPRDGKFIDRLGTYDVSTNPVTVELNSEKAISWIQKGAQLSDTTRTILSDKGVLLQIHLAKGVTKGVITKEQADAKYQSWILNKDNTIKTKREDILSKEKQQSEKRLKVEQEIKEKRSQAVIAKKLALETKLVEKARELAAAEAKQDSKEIESSSTGIAESSVQTIEATEPIIDQALEVTPVSEQPTSTTPENKIEQSAETKKVEEENPSKETAGETNQ